MGYPYLNISINLKFRLPSQYIYFSTACQAQATAEQGHWRNKTVGRGQWRKGSFLCDLVTASDFVRTLAKKREVFRLSKAA